MVARSKSSGRGGSSPRVRGKPLWRSGRSVSLGLIPARAGKTSESPPQGRLRPAHPRACGENFDGAGSGRLGLGSSPRVRGKRHQQWSQPRSVRLIPARAGKTLASERGCPRWRAHPRACGENSRARSHARRNVGSSPRVRGKQARGLALLDPPGLIPARAGKTWSARAAPTAGAAHPRACGENIYDMGFGYRERGSSPRVRGKPGRAPPGLVGRRLIPARAGKTASPESSQWLPSAHPRACGENQNGVDVGANRLGSSPRVRGKLTEIVVTTQAERLIPARAGKTVAWAVRNAARAAHPRACGENSRERVDVLVAAGSSPRVRGKPVDDGLHRGRSGLIPACAGKTGVTCWRHPVPGAHPRVCGENRAVSTKSASADGSSPRVRGKPSSGGWCPGAWRLIPACAGKTSSASPRPGAHAAHPRVCGENGGHLLAPPGARGSSPRVRGKRWEEDHWTDPVGLIPACAGKTSPTARSTPPTAAHPRVCGENWLRRAAVESLVGSSPRVRGKQTKTPTLTGRGRLIPACAGKTRPATASTRPRRAHPRVCGENAAIGSRLNFVAGSSPRVRGKPHRRSQLLVRGGLIPACAGKTAPRPRASNPRPAHPRVCGENAPAGRLPTGADGSSPRVRGKHLVHCAPHAHARLIPACAGKTRSRGFPPPSRPAHPRVCGENKATDPIQGALEGSSPRVRGKRVGRLGRARHSGLIPACAGKTRSSKSPTRGTSAHPRVCGENLPPPTRGTGIRGSSPRVRGKRRRAACRRSR